MTRKVLSAAGAVVFLLLVFSAAAAQKFENQEVTQAIAVLRPTRGNSVQGTIVFRKTKNGIRITGDVSGLTPGKHGFHIHEFGDCRAPDARSAGGHYAPGNNPHGGPDMDERHVGDLGNIEANQDGVAHIYIVDNVITLKGDQSVLGRAVVIHAGEDDFTSQPSGDAGPRVACGVIGVDRN
jgi:Cu-Zn family superoxide dismutase